MTERICNHKVSLEYWKEIMGLGLNIKMSIKGNVGPYMFPQSLARNRKPKETQFSTNSSKTATKTTKTKTTNLNNKSTLRIFKISTEEYI